MAARTLELLTPPLAYKAITNLRRYGSVRATPEYGPIFGKAAELPETGPEPWDHPNWLAHISSVSDEVPVAPFSHHATLMLLCAELGDVEVFDFGGGPAVLYPCAKHASKTLKYVVLENESIAAIGKAKFPDAHFIDDASLATGLISHGGITLCIGTLHYILDWENALPALTSTQPKYVIIGRHPSPSSNSVLWGVQTLHTPSGYCGRAKMAFIPVSEVSRVMLGLGYQLHADIPMSDQTTHVCRDSRAMVGDVTARTLVFARMKP